MFRVLQKYIQTFGRKTGSVSLSPDSTTCLDIVAGCQKMVFVGWLSVSRSIGRLCLQLDRLDVTMDRRAEAHDQALDSLDKSLKVLQDELEQFRRFHSAK